MNTQVRLNLYERGIVAALVNNHGYNPTAARSLVAKYVKIIRKLGGYDSCDTHAERLIQADAAGYNPQQWLEDIINKEQEQSLDRGIPEREHGEHYALP